MKSLKVFILALIFLLAVCFSAQAASNITFAWDKSDGAAGYKLYYGNTTSRNYSQKVDVGNVQTYTITNIADGTWYFAATAYDSSGNESDYSNEVVKTLDTSAPSAPGNFRITVTVNVTVNP